MTDKNVPLEDTSSKVERPMGVWLLPLYYGFFAGLVPLAAVAMLFFREEEQVALGLLGIELALSVLLAVAILVAAVGAWRGSNVARIAFVALLVMHYGLLIAGNLGAAATGNLSSEMQISAVARSFRYTIHISVNVWYFFLSGRPRAFYE